MKAPISRETRHILSDEKAADKLFEAHREGKAVVVQVNGETYHVKPAPGYVPRSAANRQRTAR